jgi:hypothetical protein
MFPSRRKGQAILLEEFRGRGCKGKRGVGYIPARGHVKPLKQESLVHQSAVTAGARGKNRTQNLNIEVYGEMKNVDFWDIRTQFVLHRRHITSLLHSPAS